MIVGNGFKGTHGRIRRKSYLFGGRRSIQIEGVREKAREGGEFDVPNVN